MRKENHQAFEQVLIESLEKFIRREAHERALESDEDADAIYEREASSSSILIAAPNGTYSLSTPLLSGISHVDKVNSEASTSSGEPGNKTTTNASELSIVQKAKDIGVVYLLGRGDIRARKDSWFFKKLVINYFYAFLRRNCRKSVASLSVPQANLIQVSMTYMV